MKSRGGAGAKLQGSSLAVDGSNRPEVKVSTDAETAAESRSPPGRILSQYSGDQRPRVSRCYGGNEKIQEQKEAPR